MSSPSTFETINPYSGQKIETHSYLNAGETEQILQNAFQSYHDLKGQAVSVKAQKLQSLALEFRKSSAALAELISLEMGKPLRDAKVEIEKSATACEWFGRELESLLAPENVVSHYERSRIVKDSMGPVLAIMPWNFPVWQAIRFAAPAVGIGNPILLKHSNLTAGTSRKIQKIFDSVEKGLLYHCPMDHKQTAQVLADKRVRAVTLTGSARAGREVASVAGRYLKKSVMELGGSDAYVVFEDCDIERAAEACAVSRMTNNGQSCIAAKRFLVDRRVSDTFLHAFQKALRPFRPGNPLLETSVVGTLAAQKFQSQLLDQCQELEATGARKVFDLALEEKFSWTGPDAFFPARIYQTGEDSDVAFQEEFFGPVALIFQFDSEVQALALANRSVYGLGGAVFSRDLERAESFARKMECGFVAINDTVKSDPRLPFGGVKDSGYGRELSRYGFDEFCNVKTLGFGK
jgi:succinate-semialdehyde dehydrogenase/glutarate-semialdehyde dehydrogenase